MARQYNSCMQCHPLLSPMTSSFAAIIDTEGNVKLLEAVHFYKSQKAIVTIIADEEFDHTEIATDQENQAWNQFSLEQAMRGLEEDNLPEYTEADLMEKWQ